MFRRLFRLGLLLVVVGVIVALGYAAWLYTTTRQTRQALYEAIEPVAVSNCELKRFGDAHDGGYLLCGNLLAEVQVAYSYGINGTDNWGCQISETLKVATHQYECFNTTAPDCRADTRFHAECVGPGPSTFEGLPFDSVANQIAKNGDAGKRVVMKMDVEGSEWESLLASPDAVLNAIDQIAIEFHEVEKPAFVATIERLKQFFYVAHVHMNNFTCEPGFEPFPSQVFELLLVSKRLGKIDPSVNARGPSPLDAPNTTTIADCQVLPPGGELENIGDWARRKRVVWYNDWKDRLLPPY